jgi:hypothetical protein
MGLRPGKGRRRLVVASVVVLVGLVALVSLAPSLYDVQAKGHGPPLVPYEHSGLVYKVRVLDLFSIYADEESRPSSDKLSAIGLIVMASMSLMALLLLNAARAERRVRSFYLVATLGLAYLAADEMFAFHETIGHNLRFLADLPGVERPDDVIFLSYGLPLAIFAWSFRDVLFAKRRATELFAVGAGLFAVAAAGDLAGVGIDEPAEVLAAGCLTAGLVIVTADVLTRELALGRAPEAPAGITARRQRQTVLAP